MKRINKYLNILNIFTITIFLVFTSLFNDICIMYPIGLYGSFGHLAIVLISDIVIGIINIVKKHRAIGILSIIAVVLPIVVVGIHFMFKIEIYVLLIISIVFFYIISILNLFLNRKIVEKKHSKISLIVFCTFVITNIVIVAIPLIQYNSDMQAFEKALSTMQNKNYPKTYIIQENENDFIFMDENMENIISKQQFNGLDKNLYTYKINNTTARFFFGVQDNHGVVISSNGEILLKINTKYTSAFVTNMIHKEKYKITKGMSEFFSYNNEYNRMTKYLETNKKYEENPKYQYLYFKNNEITKKVLQVIFTTNLEGDLELSDAIIKCDESEPEFIENFYKYKKEYYLIDFEANTRQKLECNNLIYEAIDNVNTVSESILLFSNGNIPFYDSNETGYFDLSGKKVSLSKPYLIYDCTDKYAIVYDKKSFNSFILSLETREVERQFEGKLLKYKNFYILEPFSYDASYTLLDNNFNPVSESYREPEIIDENVVALTTPEYNNYVYMYKDGKFAEKYKSQNRQFRVLTSDPIYVFQSSIYANLGLDN